MGGAQGARAPPVFLELLRRNILCTCIWPDLYYIVHPQILALCNIPVLMTKYSYERPRLKKKIPTVFYSISSQPTMMFFVTKKSIFFSPSTIFMQK